MAAEANLTSVLVAAIGAVSLFLAGMSAWHFNGAYMPPAELYDNERAILALLYGVASAVFCIAALALPIFNRRPLSAAALSPALLSAGYLLLADRKSVV